MRNNITSKLLLGASILAVLSTGALASNVNSIAAEEFSTNKIATKIFSTNDYLLNLDVGQEAEKIAETVRRSGQNQLPRPRLEQDARAEITRLLTLAKAAPLQDRTLPNGSIITTNYRNDDLSIAFKKTPLVYPCLSLADREKPDAFLPRGYVGNFMSKALCDHIRTYSYSLGLNEQDAKRLNSYLQPLFYAAQLEAHSLLGGEVEKNLYHSPRWVYTKSYAQMLESLQYQASHHMAMRVHTPINGLNEDQVTQRVTEELLDLALAFLPNPNRALHQDRGLVYVLGRNVQGAVSLLHPYADFLPYPVLKENRLRSGANIPHNFPFTADSRKQWRRTDQFVDLSDYHFSDQEKRAMKWLMEGIGTLFHKHLSTFHVQRFPIGEHYEALTEEMAINFVNNSTIPEPYFTAFYHRDIDPDIHHVLAGIKSKGDTHRALTADLWPRRLADEDTQKALINEGIKFLMFNDILDRADIFNGVQQPQDGNEAVARMNILMRR